MNNPAHKLERNNHSLPATNAAWRTRNALTLTVSLLLAGMWAAYGLTYASKALGNIRAKKIIASINTFFSENAGLRGGLLLTGGNVGLLTIAFLIDRYRNIEVGASTEKSLPTHSAVTILSKDAANTFSISEDNQPANLKTSKPKENELGQGKSPQESIDRFSNKQVGAPAEKTIPIHSTATQQEGSVNVSSIPDNQPATITTSTTLGRELPQEILVSSQDQYAQTRLRAFSLLTERGLPLPSEDVLLPCPYPSLCYEAPLPRELYTFYSTEIADRHINFKYDNITFLFFPPSAQLLIPTKNRLHSATSIAGIQQQVSSLFSKNLPPHIDLNTKKELDFNRYKKGVCQGITQFFISKYHDARANGWSFKAAAMQAANYFYDGRYYSSVANASSLHASHTAAALQWIHHIATVNETFTTKCIMNKWIAASYFFGFQILKQNITSVTIVEFPLTNQLSSLENGTYHIASEWSFAHDKAVKGKTVIEPGRHAMVLLVEDQSFLILDPTLGLISHANPDDYFMLQTQGPHEGLICSFMVCASIAQGHSVDFTQDPPVSAPPRWVLHPEKIEIRVR